MQCTTKYGAVRCSSMQQDITPVVAEKFDFLRGTSMRQYYPVQTHSRLPVRWRAEHNPPRWRFSDLSFLGGECCSHADKHFVEYFSSMCLISYKRDPLWQTQGLVSLPIEVANVSASVWGCYTPSSQWRDATDTCFVVILFDSRYSFI